VVLGAWGGFKRRIITSLTGIIGLGLGIFLIGIAPPQAFVVGVAGCALIGFMGPIANGPLLAIMQSKVPPEMQGRVMGLTNSICMAMMPIALAIAAPVADGYWEYAPGIGQADCSPC